MIAGEEKSEQNIQESNLRPQMHGESSACNSIAGVPCMRVTSSTALGAESHLARKNFLEFQTEIHNLMQQQHRKQASVCHQLKIFRRTDDDIAEVVRNFDKRETQPLIDKIKQVENQWRTLETWNMVELVNQRNIYLLISLKSKLLQ